MDSILRSQTYKVNLLVTQFKSLYFQLLKTGIWDYKPHYLRNQGDRNGTIKCTNNHWNKNKMKQQQDTFRDSSNF